MNKPIFTHNNFVVYRDIFGVWTATDTTTMNSIMSNNLDKVFAYMDADKVFEPLPDEVREFIDNDDDMHNEDINKFLSKHDLFINRSNADGCPTGLARPLKIKAIKQEPTLWARKCSVTNEGMDEGWVAYEGEKYFKNEEDAIAWVESLGYNDLGEAYDDGVIYWTEWHDDETECQYIEIDGKLEERDV